MTHLRKMMLDELERRNFTDSTRRAYFRIIEDFARHFNRPPDQLGPAHIREYTAHLFRDRKLSDSSVHQTVGALRFFFVKMRKRPWRVEETPYPKRRTRLPVILSREEVARLIESASNPFHRTILMTLYATGVRRAELARLKLTDIDTERMVLHIRNGKGRKDRDVVLSPHLLTELRQHYRRLAPKPATWLFRDIAPDALIAGTETGVIHEILPDGHRVAASRESQFDGFAMRSTCARSGAAGGGRLKNQRGNRGGRESSSPHTPVARVLRQGQIRCSGDRCFPSRKASSCPSTSRSGCLSCDSS